MNWILLNDKKPTVSSYYKVKATGIYSNVKSAYYDIHTGAWIYDDGTWLPVDVRLYITHWMEVK